MPTDEFSLIETFFTRPATAEHVRLDIGDDAALIDVSACAQIMSACQYYSLPDDYAITDKPQQVASRLVNGCLKKIQPASPRFMWCTLSLTLPFIDEDWLSAFSDELLYLCEHHELPLVGGDTTRGHGLLVLHASACLSS